MAEGIDYASEAPLVLVGDGIHFFGSSFYGSCADCVWIGDGEDDSDRDAAEGFGAVVVVLGRFVAEPEFSALDGQSGDDALGVSHVK